MSGTLRRALAAMGAWVVLAAAAATTVACGRTQLEEFLPRTQPPVVPRLSSFNATSDVPIGVIRWDGAPKDPAIRAKFTIGPTLLTRYAHLQPKLGWYLYGPGIDTQAIVDAEILQDDGAVGHYAFVWYPPHEVLDPADDHLDVSDIQLPFDAYLKSPYKDRIKFALILQSGWLKTPKAGVDWGYLDVFAAWVRDHTRDPQYQTIDGKPLVYLFGSPDMPTERWNQFKATVGSIYAVDVNHQPSHGIRLSLQALVTYGPAGATLTGSGQRPWSVQRDIDRSHWGPSGPFADARSMTPLCDSRARRSTAIPYGDQPTQPEWLEHIQAAISGKPKLVLIYARNEYDEAGGTTGSSFRDGTRFNDALRWARGAPRPARYTYEIDAHSFVCTGVGTWAYDFPGGGLSGAFCSDEVLSSNPGDTRFLAHPAVLGFTEYATTGPDRGIQTVELDGTTLAIVDLYAPSVSRHVAVWTSPPLDGSDHTVQVTVTGRKRAESSGMAIGVDSFAVTYAP